MDIDGIHTEIIFLEKKQTGSYHSPSEIDNQIHRAQMDLFWKYAPVYGEDAEAKAALDPFRKIFQFTPNNSPGGQLDLPSDLGDTSPLNYGRLLSGQAISYDNTINPSTGFPRGVQYWDVEFVNDDELAQRLRSQIKPVTPDKPIATTTDNGVIQLYPQQPNTGIFTYLALPVAPLWAYTQTGRAFVYNAGASRQLQWNESFFSKIIAKALFYLGINLNDGEIIQLMSQTAAT